MVGGRNHGVAMSATRARKGGVGLPRVSKMPPMPQGVYNTMFPPLNQTSFSDQYKTFKALGGF